MGMEIDDDDDDVTHDGVNRGKKFFQFIDKKYSVSLRNPRQLLLQPKLSMLMQHLVLPPFLDDTSYHYQD
jgi:hypothetical protein